MILKKILQEWLLKDIIEEQKAQWQSIWDRKTTYLLRRKFGEDINIMEIDYPEIKFLNSFENKKVGMRIIAGYIDKDGTNNVFEYIKDIYKLSNEEVVKRWKDIEEVK